MEYQLMRPNEADALNLHSATVAYEQTIGGPLHLLIASNATDADLERVAARFDVPLAELREFRESA